MTRAKGIGAAVALAAVIAFGCGLGWWSRWVVVRLLPMEHTGVVDRVTPFEKPVNVRFSDTRTGRQFAVVFADGFNCEGWDSSLLTARPGDTATVVGYPDVKGYPLLDPDWWSCADAQLVHVAPHENAP
jgi:hypothetical protein